MADPHVSRASSPSPLSASPLLTLPGAVDSAPDSVDHGVAWHYGDPFTEQRAATTGVAVVDRSHRAGIRLAGDERLTWLHSITSQHLAALSDRSSAEDLVLDVAGHVEQHFVLTDLDGVTWIDTEPTHGAALLDYLQKMVFWAKAEPTASDELAVLTLLGPGLEQNMLGDAVAVPDRPYAAAPLPGGGFVRRMPWPGVHAADLLVPRDQLTQWWQRLTAAGAAPAGMWTFEALRVADKHPRLGLDTDERAIPHELGWIGGVEEAGAVHLDKGCYRGQETVARVHNLGKPPRNLVLLHLDGSADGRPETGDPVLTAEGRTVGRLGTVVDHHELGPIALALVKRTVPADTPLTVGPCAAAIDPDSLPAQDRFQPGRAAVDRLRGR